MTRRCPAPARQTQLVFAGIPALTHGAPIAPAPLALHQLLDARALTQLEQVGLADRLQRAHLAFAAIGTVASNQLRALCLGQALQQGQQAGPRVHRAVPVAGLELRIEHQAQVADPVGVDGMAGPPGLVRVVADHGAVLLAIQRLDGGVAVQNPRRGGGLRDAVPELLLHPLHRARKLRLLGRALRLGVLGIGCRRDGAQGAAQAVVANDLFHPQDARGHTIAAQCAHMRVAACLIEERADSALRALEAPESGGTPR